MGKNSRCEATRERRSTEPLGREDGVAERSVRRRVLVAFPDVAQRIDSAASLILAGHHVILARSLDHRARLIGAVHVVVADGRLVNGLDRSTYEALRRSIFIAMCEPDVPTPLVARIRLAPSLDGDDLVTAVTMLAWSGAESFWRAAHQRPAKTMSPTMSRISGPSSAPSYKRASSSRPRK
ncbi:MAG TPA: hypothetical protein VK698_00430 [Kofleriaceae bacterium]|nr:hypothetical protein [Kofleriaceae bacterium]